jgi:hypothetical protein
LHAAVININQNEISKMVGDSHCYACIGLSPPHIQQFSPKTNPEAAYAACTRTGKENRFLSPARLHPCFHLINNHLFKSKNNNHGKHW